MAMTRKIKKLVGDFKMFHVNFPVQIYFFVN